MTYFQFIHAVETKVKKEVEEEKTVSIHTNVKNNGVRRSGYYDFGKRNQYFTDDYLEEYFHSSGWGIRGTDCKRYCLDYMRKSGFRIHGRTVKR